MIIYQYCVATWLYPDLPESTWILNMPGLDCSRYLLNDTVVDLKGRGPGIPLFWVKKKEKITEEKLAGKAKQNWSPPPPHPLS